MSRRGECIYKRKDGRWEARYACGRDNSGKTLYRSIYATTYSEVKAKRQLALVDKQQNMLNVTGTSFAETLQHWLKYNRVRLKEQTYQKYRICVEKHILPELGAIDVNEISAAMIQDYLYQKLMHGRLDGKGGLSKSYVRSISVIVTSALDYAVSCGMRSRSIGKIHRPKVERRSVYVLRWIEQEILERQIKNDLSGSNLAIYLSLHTGMRLSEVCALCWQNVDIKSKNLYISSSVIRINSNGHAKLHIGIPKTGTSLRVIPLTQTLIDVLQNEHARITSEYVIKSCRNQGFMNPRTLENRFKKLLESCDLPQIPFHALRHTFATRWIENGMDIKSLSEILGHANVNTTLEIYVHSSDELKRYSMERMEAISGQKTGNKNDETVE